MSFTNAGIFLSLTKDTLLKGGKHPDFSNIKMWKSTCSDFKMPLIISCISTQIYQNVKNCLKMDEMCWKCTCRRATITKSSWERLAAKRRNWNSRRRSGLCGHVVDVRVCPHGYKASSFSPYDTMVLLPPSLKSVLVSLLALKSKWSPSHIDLTLTTCWCS